MGRITDYQTTIADQLDFFIEKGQELPDEIIQYKPSNEEWSIQEILAHTEEFPLYFTKELIEVIKHDQPEWGRGFEHPERLAAVNAAFDRETSSLLDGLAQTKTTVQERLDAIEDEDLDRVTPHRNPKFGEKPMQFLIDHFLVEHLETHQNQLNRVVNQYQNQTQN
ncbi:DinB family protein [Salsuginibacillus kocurii]|uniref:DinB family protein n=1 Tax=Salsuginibacillus kocurii TaxID=427078 RepID=UPI000362980A|nr:DinB family protein [Salsuginibacillus kocurii]